MKRLVALAFVVVLAGCAAPIADDTGGKIGEVEGVSHDDQLAISVEDGLNETEQEQLARRAMARIEVIRGLDYDQTVGIEVINRSEYRANGPSFGDSDPDWTNQRWEALFVAGEDQNVVDVFDDASAAGVQGYYRPSEERLTVVSDSGIDTETLVHELVHALQHQQFGLSDPSETQDSELGYTSVLEGEAELVTERYFDRCGVSWECIQTDSEGGETTDVPLGLRLYINQPYTQGQEFVAELRDSGDWDAVDALHERPPNSSEQVIHPERYPDETPVDVTVPDRSSEEWERLDPPTDTLGETSVYAMFLHNGVITVDDATSYDHSFSEGWAGDTLVPYQSDAGESGYVWETRWDSQEDADQFRFAYEEVLTEHDAIERGGGRFVVPDGSFADAIRVTQEGTTVRIVNAPSVDSLSAIHAP
jgi:hypothetical protein